MVVAINTIMTWCRVPNNRRAAIIAELLPSGLEDLDVFTAEEIQNAIKGFRTLSVVEERFNLTAASTKKIIQLASWVRDRVRLGLPVEFSNGTTNPEFNLEIEAASKREVIQKERKKATENLATSKIEPPLKSAAGWESWADAVKAVLSVAYGTSGVPLLYVIRKDTNPVFEGENWEELAINCVPLEGLPFEADRKTVHLFLMNNISEDSDAHAYIQSLIPRNNGRSDWKALEERYENEAMTQARINEANQVWDQLVYKNERAMSFEIFSKKLVKALQHFERAGRPKHDGDVIDWIWKHIQSSDVAQLVSALKAGQSINIRSAKEILQEIAKEIPNVARTNSFQPRISEIKTTTQFTFEGEAPSEGAHTHDGKLYCGSYKHKRWFSEEMAPYREQITTLRDKYNPKGGKGKSGKGSGSKAKSFGKQSSQAKRKLQQLKKQNQELNRKLSALKATVATSEASTVASTLTPDTNQAGTSFGGRNSMHP